MVNANSSQIMNGVGEHFDPKKKKKGTSYHQLHECQDPWEYSNYCITIVVLRVTYLT